VNKNIYRHCERSEAIPALAMSHTFQVNASFHFVPLAMTMCN